MFNRLPPQAMEAEKSILAHCLISDADIALDILCPDDFYKESHRQIFEAIHNLHSTCSPVELLSVINYLRDKNLLEKCGGASYLAELMDCPIPSNIEHYAKIIKDKAILRKIIIISGEITSECFDSSDAESALDSAQKKIIEISYDDNDLSITPISDTLDLVVKDLEHAERGQITGIPTNITKLDLILGGLQPTDSIILAGRPAMGKTSFALNLVDRISVDQRIPSIIFSLEMSKKQLVKRMISMRSRIDGGRFLNNMLSSADWEKIVSVSSKINNAPIFIDDRSGLSYQQVRRSMRKAIKKYGIKLAVIDYLQLMSGDKADGRTGEVGSISRAVKGMAKEFEIPIILISQLSRKCEDRNDKRPVLGDLRDSGEIEQDADIAMFVYRDEVYNNDQNNPNRGIAEIIIRKHREGSIGTINMVFLKAYQKFEELTSR